MADQYSDRWVARYWDRWRMAFRFRARLLSWFDQPPLSGSHPEGYWSPAQTTSIGSMFVSFPLHQQTVLVAVRMGQWLARRRDRLSAPVLPSQAKAQTQGLAQ